MSIAKPDKAPHLPELDGIRGLAILGVLCSHIAGMGGVLNIISPAAWEKVALRAAIPLWGGVDLFFVLSGFLITGILLRTKRSKSYFSSFYARRMLRIFPIYYLTLILSLFVGIYFGEVGRQLPVWTSEKVSYFLYLQNWPIFWHGDKTMGSVWGVYWSLAVEEQFYFAWPLLIFLCSEKNVMRICVLAIPCAIVLRIYLCCTYFGGQFGLLQLTSSRVDGLLMGAICATYMHFRKKPLPMSWIAAIGAAGAVIMAVIAVADTKELVETGRWMGMVGSTGFALLSMALVAASQHPLPWLKRCITLSWLRSAGKYSYGMYVYHILVIFAMRRYLINGRIATHGAGIPYGAPIKILAFCAEIFVVYLAARFSYELVETRFLRLKSHFEPVAAAARNSAAEQSLAIG